MAWGFEAGPVSASRVLCPGVRSVTVTAKSLVGTAFEAGADVAFRSPGHADIEERWYSVYWKRRQG
jgi:hypothetical protein